MLAFCAFSHLGAIFETQSIEQLPTHFNPPPGATVLQIAVPRFVSRRRLGHNGTDEKG
jgi:hypothetical protein